MNPVNTVFSVKRLMGRNSTDPQVEADINNWSFKVTTQTSLISE